MTGQGAWVDSRHAELSGLAAGCVTRTTSIAMTKSLAVVETASQKSTMRSGSPTLHILSKFTHFPQVVPQETFSWEQRTLSTVFFPHAHTLLVKNGHGGHGIGSSWHAWRVKGWPQGGGGRLQG